MIFNFTLRRNGVGFVLGVPSSYPPSITLRTTQFGLIYETYN